VAEEPHVSAPGPDPMDVLAQKLVGCMDRHGRLWRAVRTAVDKLRLRAVSRGHTSCGCDRCAEAAKAVEKLAVVLQEKESGGA